MVGNYAETEIQVEVVQKNMHILYLLWTGHFRSFMSFSITARSRALEPLLMCLIIFDWAGLWPTNML